MPPTPFPDAPLPATLHPEVPQTSLPCPPVPQLDWRDTSIPVSRAFDDPYFSLSGGLAETKHVFLAGNDLPNRLRDGFHIAELGFGTGLNLLATLLAHTESLTHTESLAHTESGHLHYTSFEAFPLPAPDIARALAAFPDLSAVAQPFLDQWAPAMAGTGRGNGAITLHFATATANVILGGAGGEGVRRGQSVQPTAPALLSSCAVYGRNRVGG